MTLFDFSDPDRLMKEAQAVTQVSNEIIRRLPKGTTPENLFASLVRKAIDEVLMLHPKRYSIRQLDAPEQTYIGTRVEILVKEALDLATGQHADANIAGHEVDIKWSKTLGWMIGPENIGTICLGIGADRQQSTVSAGLFVPHKELLGSQNRDRKFSIGGPFRNRHVRWIVREAPLPPNFIEQLDPRIREEIMAGSSAQERMRKLAHLVSEKPIPRSALQFVSLNKADFMRRIREDTLSRNPPLGEMVCLSWKYRKKELKRLGITASRDEFVFVHRSKL